MKKQENCRSFLIKKTKYFFGTLKNENENYGKIIVEANNEKIKY